MEDRLAWIRQILENQETATDATDIVRNIKVDLFKDRSRLEREWKSMRKCAVNLKAIVDSR